MEEILKKTFYDPSSAGSFGGVQRLYNEVSKKHDVTEAEVKDFLSRQNTYSLHRDRRFRFKRNKIIALYTDFN